MSYSTAPTYLVRQSSSYCFRMSVPSDLREVVGRRELRYSLKTGFLSEAKYRSRRMAGFVQGLFRYLREEGKMKEISDTQIQKLIAEEMKEALEGSEYRRLMADEPHDGEEAVAQAETYGILASEAREQLAVNDYRKISRYVDDLIEEKGSKSRKTLCRTGSCAASP